MTPLIAYNIWRAIKFIGLKLIEVARVISKRGIFLLCVMIAPRKPLQYKGFRTNFGGELRHPEYTQYSIIVFEVP